MLQRKNLRLKEVRPLAEGRRQDCCTLGRFRERITNEVSYFWLDGKRRRYPEDDVDGEFASKIVQDGFDFEDANNNNVSM